MTKTLLAETPPFQGQAAVDRHVALLLEQWQRDGEVNLLEFWRDCQADRPATPEDELELLSALIKTDLRCRIERGMSVEIEDYLDPFPELRRGNNRVISLIYEEYCLREECGESPDTEEFCRRYASWKNSLVCQFQLHRMFNPADDRQVPTARYPKPGDQFEEYHLISLIGKGGSSRVFLARDLSLGGKRVVLKVSLDQGQEPKTQGVLDHPHIVPVNSVVFQLEEGLRGLSMPFRPGLPLDEVLRRVGLADPPRSAMTLWNVLFAGDSPSLSPLSPEQLAVFRTKGPSGEGWAGFPRTGTYAEGVAWVAMILGRALHYAHGMKTFHRDVKPGNVLLTFQHGPQLLDFNLAESPYAAQHAKSAVLGGTLPYMAPEQIEAFLDPECWDRVGARSDIYSLGLVLRELLTGEPPDLPNERLRLPASMRDLLERRRRLVTDVRQLTPDVPHALNAIVKCCLCFRPEERYSSAIALADDLECFLARRPLVVAVNPSRRERMRNWIARNRRGLVLHSIYLSLIVFLAFQVVAPHLKPDPEKTSAFQKAMASIDQHHYREAVVPLRNLVSEYPQAPIPLAYLAIGQANSDRLMKNDAQDSMERVLALPGARDALLAWCRKHPALSEHFVDFARNQIDHLARFKRDSGTAGPSTKEQDEEDNQIKRQYIETIHQVLQLAADAGCDTLESQGQMAIAEESLGRLEPAYNRLTRLIDAAQARGVNGDRVRFLDWIIQRARITVRWSAEVQAKGSPADQQRLIELLLRSRADLDQCGDAMSVLARESVPSANADAKGSVYQYYWISTEVWLALGHAQSSRGKEAEAVRAFTNASADFKRLDDYGRSNFPDHPAIIRSLRQRVRAVAGVR
ncbi:MAG: serine/threonine protein kinase [Isosphaeraceae bacterium]